MSQSYNNYTPQQILNYLQSIKSFENFDQSTLILQSQLPNEGINSTNYILALTQTIHINISKQNLASLHIRITQQQHVPLTQFIEDCILISQHRCCFCF